MKQVPNVEDVARWLRPLTPSGTAVFEAGGVGGAVGARANAHLELPMAKVFKVRKDVEDDYFMLTRGSYQFGEAFRPTRLDRYVIGYTAGGNDFAFVSKLRLEVYEVLLQHAKNKPVLIFAATRKSESRSVEKRTSYSDTSSYLTRL